MNEKEQQTTDFGFQQVAVSEKAGKVAGVFSSVASKYDVMNDVMSFGIHRLWKRYAVSVSGIRSGHNVLDVAGGTGDLTKAWSKRVGDKGQVILTDINAEMLEVGRDNLLDQGYAANVDYVQADAEHLPFADNYFDCISIGFGLRNVTNKDQALKEMLRLLKPGGRVLVLEFSKPMLSWLEKIYDRYSFSLLPWLGKIIANDEASYRYLAESIRMHPDQDTLKSMMQAVGYDNCDYYNLTGGIVALHKGYKY